MELDRNEVGVHHIFHVGDEFVEEFDKEGDASAGQQCSTDGQGQVSRVVACDDDHDEGNEAGIFLDNIQLQTTPKGKENSAEATVSTPAVGMTYETWEEIDLHFRCYAKQNGFAVCRTSSGVRQREGVLTKEERNVIWKCDIWGKNKSDSNQMAINVPPVNVPNTIAL